MVLAEVIQYKTGVINDPLGQPTVLAGSEGRTDNLCEEIVFTTGRDCNRPRGSATI